jgi:aminopeptidase Y
MRSSSFLVSLLAAAATAQLADYSMLESRYENAAANIFRRQLPLITSEALQSTIKIENLMARAQRLYAIAGSSNATYGHPTRVIESPGHLDTLTYIQSELAKLGDYYNVTTQPFSFQNTQITNSSLYINGTNITSEVPMSYTPGTPNNAPYTAQLILVADLGCDAANYPATVKGNIALIKRGTCTFASKSTLAHEAGAAVAIIYNNNQAEGPLNGQLGSLDDSHAPTIGTSADDAAPWVAALQAGQQISATAFIDVLLTTYHTTNVIAQTTAGDPNNVVMLGAHSDSVEPGPGINDDGTGTNSLLEIATQLAQFTVVNAVRFAWWAAEEEGLVGSDWYADHLSDEENLKIRLFQDYDMLASPNFAYQVYDANNTANPEGSEELRDLYVKWYDDHGIPWTYVPFDGRSDYDGFIRNGIPAGGVATGAEKHKTPEEVALFGGVADEQYDPCYHLLCDDAGNVNATAWEVNTKVSAAISRRRESCTLTCDLKARFSRRCNVCALDVPLPETDRR